MKRITLGLVSLICLLTTSSLINAIPKENWISVRSKNFLLVGNGSEKEIRHVATRLEQFRDVFAKLFTRANVSSPVPTTVIVFKSDSSYKPFKPKANTAGFFQHGDDINYITLTTELQSDDP